MNLNIIFRLENIVIAVVKVILPVILLVFIILMIHTYNDMTEVRKDTQIISAGHSMVKHITGGVKSKGIKLICF